jgi:hypothetical protein
MFIPQTTGTGKLTEANRELETRRGMPPSPADV